MSADLSRVRAALQKIEAARAIRHQAEVDVQVATTRLDDIRARITERFAIKNPTIAKLDKMAGALQRDIDAALVELDALL